MNPSQFLEAFVSTATQAALLVALAHWIGRWTADERIQCRLWFGCFVSLLIATALAAVVPHFRIAIPSTILNASLAMGLATWTDRIGRGLFYIWGTGVVATLLAFAWQMISLQRFTGRCELLVQDLELDSELRLHSDGIRFLASSQIAVPFCWQFHQPYIVLPAFVLSLSDKEKRHVLKHEIEHLRTGHPLQLFVQRLAEVLFWYHPAVWWASGQAAQVREFVCDDAAVEVSSKQQIIEYLRTLLTIVERAADHNAETGRPLEFGRGASLIARRAQRLVNVAHGALPPRPRIRSRMPLFANVIGATAILAVVWFPANALASPHAHWSPWPTWSARVMHNLGAAARDFEVYDSRTNLIELRERSAAQN